MVTTNLAWRNPRSQKRRVPKLDAHRRHTRLPLDSGQQGRIRAASYGGRYRAFSDDHVLGVRGGDPRFSGDDISVAKYYDFDKDFLLELEPCSTHYEMYDK